MQLPRFRDVLARMCALIKPGGYLILEEIDARTYSEHRETPEAVTFFYDRLADWASQKGETYDVGRELQPCISKMRMFHDVTVKVLTVPFSPDWAGRKCLSVVLARVVTLIINASLEFDFAAVEVGALGNTMKQSLLKASAMLVKVVPGLTEESVAKWKLALEEPEHELRLRVYFLAARKRLVSSPPPSLNLDEGLTCVSCCQLQTLPDTGSKSHPDDASPSNRTGPALFRRFFAIILDGKKPHRCCELVSLTTRVRLTSEFGDGFQPSRYCTSNILPLPYVSALNFLPFVLADMDM